MSQLRGERTPRSEGRTAATGSKATDGRATDGKAAKNTARGATAKGTGARGTRPSAVDGTAALRLDGPVPAGAARATEAAPRLRVAPPAPITVPRAPFVALIVAAVVAGVFGILVINTKTNENAFRISRLQEHQAALDTQQQQLEKDIAGYESPGSLDAAARRLGLVRADTPAYIRLPDGKIIRVPRPASGLPSITSQQDAGR
jgi:hypothetical protein